MNDLTPIAFKLSKLIPRLATDRCGKVIATVRAIQRTLRAQRLDLHDVAQAVVRPEERVLYLEGDPGLWAPRT